MLTLASFVGFSLELKTKVLDFALYDWNNWIWQNEIGGPIERRGVFVSRRGERDAGRRGKWRSWGRERRWGRTGELGWRIEY